MLLGGEVASQGEEDCNHTAFNCAARDSTEEQFSSGLYPWQVLLNKALAHWIQYRSGVQLTFFSWYFCTKRKSCSPVLHLGTPVGLISSYN